MTITAGFRTARPTRARFSGFGPFRADVDGATAVLPPITRTMLARLVLARGGLVDADDLYRECWPDPAPTVRREQRVAVHKRIAELRRCLSGGRIADSFSVLLTERSARTGYRLLLDADQVDLHVFADLVFRAAAVRDAVAVDLLVQALGMWTERPLLGLPDKAFVRDHVARLTKLRDRACRELVAGCRALGRTWEAMAAFDRLEAKHPDDIGLRELIDQLCCIQPLA
jgi:DNA-binding SARP family transcriptional activator